MGLFNLLFKKRKSSKMNQIWQLEDKNNMVMALHDYLTKKSSYGKKIKKLSKEEAIFYLCQVLEVEINNGGFNQYFFNPSGNYSLETLQALKLINANKTSLIHEKAISIFPNSIVPKNRAVRQELLDEILEDEKKNGILNDADDDFYKYEDDLLELNYSFIIANKESFK